MGNPSDSTPNFDFLNPKADDPSSTADESPAEETSAQATPDETPAGDDGDDPSVFSDMDDIPAPEENISDGSTLVIHNRDNAAKFDVPAETFATEEPTQELTPPTGYSEPTPAESASSVDSETEESDAEEVAPAETKPSDSTPNFGFLSGVEAPSFPTPKKSTGPAINLSTEPQPPAEANSPTNEETVEEVAADAVEDSSEKPVNKIVSQDVAADAGKEPSTSEIEDPDSEQGSSKSAAEPTTAEQPEPTPETKSEAKPDPEPAKASAPAVASTAVAATFMGLNQRTALIMLASYASLITLLLIMWVMSQKAHQLETLPDVVPEAEGQLTHIPPHQPLPKYHTLAVGDSERYGDLKIEVVKITQEPIQFVHYNGDTSRSKEPTKPVWKLWLRFTNMSEIESFAPLDRDLTLRWITKAEQMREYSNYYISPKDAADGNVPTIQMYRLPKASDWDMQAQHLGVPLAPGESVETYIATSDEQPLDLEGDLVWRFQVRKGIVPGKDYGVTTMVEVAFTPDQIAQNT